MTKPEYTLPPEKEKVYRKIAGLIAFSKKLKSEPAQAAAWANISRLLIETGDWEVGEDGNLILDENRSPVRKKKGGSDEVL
tara:strand:+ start:195 stop:437 length:243 start_codon:yes stop_codon:yes gene_type:complete